jgi:hypothetical protein
MIGTIASQEVKTSNTLRDVCLTAFICFGFICVAELALHLSGVRFEASLFQMDPVRSYSFRPGASGWHTAESDIFVHINEQGERGPVHSTVPAPGTLRIAVMGSSTTAGLEVEEQQTYAALLERDLSRPGLPVEVMNFAVEGYGPAQDFYTLQNQVWRFHPQIVMDEVSLKQYVLNSTRKYSTTSIPYPYFKLTPNGLVPDDVSGQLQRPTPLQIARSNRIRNIVNSLDLVLLAVDVQKQLKLRLKRLLSFHSPEAGAEDPLGDPWHWALVPPSQPEIEQGWEVLEALTLAMRDQSAAHGAEFWVIASDDAFQVNPNPEVGEKLRRQMKANSLNYGDDRYDSFLTQHEVNHIHLAPALLAYVRKTGAYLHGGPKMPPGEGHWNVLGHQVVAQIIAGHLEEQSNRLRQWHLKAYGSGQDHLQLAGNPITK